MRKLVSITPRHFARLSNASINPGLKNQKTEICVTTPKSVKREVQIILALTFKMAGNPGISQIYSPAVLLDTRVFGCIFLPRPRPLAVLPTFCLPLAAILWHT
jgi:hypothetical protein